MKAREMLYVLPLLNNSVIIRWSFLLVSILAIISLNAIVILGFLFGLYSSMSFIWFEYSIKTLELLQFFNPILSCLLVNNWYFASYESLAYR